MTPACRLCAAPLQHQVLDLGPSPLANSYLTAAQLGEPETFYPLRLWVCTACWLVQLEQVESPARIFAEYAYFSSYSRTWLEHARRYAERMIDARGLDGRRLVVEVASNDGYLLQYFADRGIPTLGIEPAGNVARAARARGIPTVGEFFDRALGERLAADGVRADVLVANNVLAHVPALVDFVAGLATVLAPGGVLTIEVPHLLRLLAEHQFDTIYHEHLSYFSVTAADRLLAAHDLLLLDVEELPTHGGSLRLWARHAGEDTPARAARVEAVQAQEAAAGLLDLATYRAFAEAVRETKRGLLEFLIGLKRGGRSIVGYGAAAKGNTLLNYCGIRDDFLDYTVDRSPHKQGRFLPGTRIPVYAPSRIAETRPDYVLILPWNLHAEIVEEMAHVRDWGGQFVVPIPAVKIL
jgi:SAM-dependent methyltransferase